jgi:hypothetical protein
MHVPIQVMLLHVLGGAISARSLSVAFCFTRSTAITTGTEGDVFLVLVLLAIRKSSIHDALICFSAIVERLVVFLWMKLSSLRNAQEVEV